ncbi:inositol monophosphatase [Geminicoccaceae bacterium 1502E]|nr:inositol monophosphatase [Geminicoccaceae bacterium 1502E]
MHDDNPSLRLAAIQAVAQEAGALGMHYFRRRDTLVVEGKGLQDIVSIADRAVEDLIRGRIAELFPEDGFLGEEGGHQEGSSGGTWVVDPIDGTWCFLNGIGAWCVAIAYVRDGRIEHGVIWDPNAQEMFAASRGKGASLNGQPIRTLEAASLRDGSLSVGFSHRSKPEEVSGLIGRLLEAGGMYHRHGSGALGLAWTACGRLVGYVEPHMNSWDALAGLLLIEEAGGRVNDFLADNGLLQGNRVLAGPAGLYPTLEKLADWG